jgi:RimJ/RimL family protein N-acetyltransferase
MITIESARLVWRAWRDDDLPLATVLWGDAEVTRLIGAIDPADRLARELATQRDHGVAYWPMFLRTDATSFVGCCGLRPYDPPQKVFELGVHLRPAYWGNGFAREAARAVIDHAFGPLGVAALFAGHNPANVASRKLILSLGFEHTHDERYAATGLMHPSYLLRRSPLPR